MTGLAQLHMCEQGGSTWLFARCPGAAPAPGHGEPVALGCRVTGQPWAEGSFPLCLGGGRQLAKVSPGALTPPAVLVHPPRTQ